MLKVEDIYAVVTEDGKIYLHTERDEYESKYKLYEIEETYPETF
ncbi:LytTR family transcriptional regulator DNA-binding domain-containing protein, partial [Enterobacter hormaechei]